VECRDRSWEFFLRVLCVDDDYLVLMNTAMMLEELGHEVTEATSAAQALQRLGSGEFDLLVTDFAMPGMNGYELILEVERRHPGMPVLMVSGYSNLPDQAAHAVQQLAKPFSESQLAAALARADIPATPGELPGHQP
jgi:CheY-like chemotaxis protein